MSYNKLLVDKLQIQIAQLKVECGVLSVTDWLCNSTSFKLPFVPLGEELGGSNALVGCNGRRSLFPLRHKRMFHYWFHGVERVQALLHITPSPVGHVVLSATTEGQFRVSPRTDGSSRFVCVLGALPLATGDVNVDQNKDCR